MRTLIRSSCGLPALVLAALLAVLCPMPASAGQPSFIEVDFSAPDPFRTELYGFPVWFEVTGTVIHRVDGGEDWWTYRNFAITFTNLENGKSVVVHFLGRWLQSDVIDDGFQVNFSFRAGAQLLVVPSQDVVIFMAGQFKVNSVWDLESGELVSFDAMFAGIEEDFLSAETRIRALLAD